MTCSNCGGKGQTPHVHNWIDADGQIQMTVTWHTCPSCGGSGQVPDPEPPEDEQNGHQPKGKKK